MADRPNHVGQQIGNYRLIRLLGEGAFAEVYLGEHIYLKTQVAVKVLQEKIEAQYIEDFLKEGQMIAALRHPHILRVLDFGMENSKPFLVIDYAPEGTLRHKHLRGSTVPLSTVLSYVKQVAMALQYAHSQHIVQRIYWIGWAVKSLLRAIVLPHPTDEVNSLLLGNSFNLIFCWQNMARGIHNEKPS